MNWLKEIRLHIATFETQAESELHKFVDYLEIKYKEPGPAIVLPPNPLAPNGESTFPSVVADPTPVVIAPPTVVEVPVVVDIPAEEAPEATVTPTTCTPAVSQESNVS